jgi:hypothetical protein
MSNHLRQRCAVMLAVALTLARIASGEPAATSGDAPPPASGSPNRGFVSREEYEALLRDQQALRAELDAVKRERAASQPATATSGTTDADVEAQIKAVRRDVAQLQRLAPGFDQFLIAGDAAFGFSVLRHTNSTFSASISPLLLWRPTDKLLIEAAFDIGIDTDAQGQSSSTSFDLTIANASYEVNDYLVVGGGLFVVPFGVYHNHFDPPWINKLPDDPLAWGDAAITPGSEVGIFARGAIPAGPMKLTYDVYVANGPSLVTNDADAAGSLNFDDFTDLNGNKAVGGRIGIIPMPDMEAGYSIQFSEPNPSGFHRVHALLQAVDFNYRPLIPAIRGVIDLRGEYAWSNVSTATFDPAGSLNFGPTRFHNRRDGGYFQVAYRPTMLDNKVLRRFELVGRYDFLNTPLQSPGGDHEHRLTLGIDYWVAPSAVFKIAYEFDDKKVGQRQDGFLAQFGIGF